MQAGHGLSRSHARFVEDLRRHMPIRYNDIIERCSAEVQPHMRDFKDKSKFWDIVHHIADAMQSEKFGDSLIAAMFYEHSARDILKSGETTQNNLRWARALLERATETFDASHHGVPDHAHVVDLELKYSIAHLTEQVDGLLRPQLPGKRE